MRQYDTTFIIDGKLEQDQREALIGKFENSMEKLDGKIDRIIRWGHRKLAYEINKRTHGYYVIFYYSAEPSVIKSFESELKLNENILRYMTLIFDGKHPEYIRDEDIREQESVKIKKPVQIPEEDAETDEEIPVDAGTEIEDENPRESEPGEEIDVEEKPLDSDSDTETDLSKDAEEIIDSEVNGV